MTERQYTITLDPDEREGSYAVTMPALPGCITQRDTLEEAIAMARDAIQGYIEALTKDGRPIPAEQQHPRPSLSVLPHE